MAARVYVGRLSNYARDRDIEKFFKGFGRIRDIMIKNGYCFVDFEDYRDADDAVYELNGRELCGERVIIEHARGTPHGEDMRRDIDRGYVAPSRRSGGYDRDRGSGGGGGGSGRDKYGPPTRTDFRIIVENLSSRVSWQDLKDYMRQAGEVTYADAHKINKNEGAVEFATYSEMKRALDKLDNTELNGRRIRLREDKSRCKRRSRERSRTKSRSRSPRSRSRSRSGRRSDNSRSPSPAKSN
jgi:arginine/serine-rich splicing factor 4/5/6